MATTVDPNPSFDKDDGWQEIATGKARVTVQLLTNGPVLLFWGSTPPDGASLAGFELSGDGENKASLNDLTASDNVYVRAVDERGDTQKVAVAYE